MGLWERLNDKYEMDAGREWRFDFLVSDFFWISLNQPFAFCHLSSTAPHSGHCGLCIFVLEKEENVSQVAGWASFGRY